MAPCALLVPPRSVAVTVPQATRWEILVFDVVRVPLRPREQRPDGATRVHLTPVPQPGPQEVWGMDLPLEVPVNHRATALNCLRFCGDHWWRGDRGRARANSHLQHWLTEYACSRSAVNPFIDDPAWLREVGDAVAEGLEAGVTIAGLARTGRMSRQTFHRRFVAAVGEAPSTWFVRIRLERAAHYLEHTDEPVARIAKRIGYRSRTTFARLFKKRYGAAPARWRQERG